MIYTKITGTGSYVPSKVMTNDDLKAFVETSDEWIQSRTGIKERHIVTDEDTKAVLPNSRVQLYGDQIFRT